MQFHHQPTRLNRGRRYGIRQRGSVDGGRGATGYVAPWAELEIVDHNDRPVPAGSEGIVRIRATCQGAPYPPERAAENTSFRDGWFYPGDLGRYETDGLLVLTGRTSEVINVGGLKLAPEVIEEIST